MSVCSQTDDDLIISYHDKERAGYSQLLLQSFSFQGRRERGERERERERERRSAIIMKSHFSSDDNLGKRGARRQAGVTTDLILAKIKFLQNSPQFSKRFNQLNLSELNRLLVIPRLELWAPIIIQGFL